MCRPLQKQTFATWNVEGLRGDSIVKLVELTEMMKRRCISVLCIHETHLHGAEYYKDDSGFLICLSGELDDKTRSDAGVGFIVSPWACSAIVAFRACSSRSASLRINVLGGVITLLPVDAPHGGHDVEDRQDFYSDLQGLIRPTTPHSTTVALGDFNARLLKRKAGEHNMIGEYAFESNPPKKTPTVVTNRQLLVEC